MTTRTKLALCAGLLAVAVGVWPRAKPAVEMSFVRYVEGGAVLAFTNRGKIPVQIVNGDVLLIAVPRKPEQHDYIALAERPTNWILRCDLMAQCSTQFIALPSPQTYIGSRTQHLERMGASRFQSTVNVVYVPQASTMRRRIEGLLSKIGINIASDGFVVTVKLPPRETNAPAQPVTP